MDDATLQSLHAALAAGTENVTLRMVLVGAHLERREPDRAVELLGACTPEALDEAQRGIAASALLAAARPIDALGFAMGDTPETALVRARVLCVLERLHEAKEAYQSAVARNRTLEDKALEAQLGATVVEARNGGPRLRVISNDDTSAQEVSRILAPEEETVRFEDVGGLTDVKKQIEKRIILPFTKPSLFERFKKKIGGGILLYGPPGCGKTLLARATAGECDATFFNVAISDVLDMYIGESERKLHAIFEKARASAPAVLFFDELEALAGKRQHSRDGVGAKVVSSFLSEMDGYARNNHGVLILGATNTPWAVDSAFRRPGRFDRVVFVPPPDREARAAILRLALNDRPVANDVDPEAIAKKTSGFSGADLAHLVEAAADEAIEESLARNEELPITARHLAAALADVRPTTLEWLTTARNYARYANEGGQYDDVLAFLAKHAKA
ncbi:MAG: ATP-binding protein [Sandaracinus sp.]|nr:ATP-binding protein [Sandaracinus sp.]MCB9613131.1 ATP-binding protein [Sandaracinus sp.]